MGVDALLSAQAMQEVVGKVTELILDNIDQHSSCGCSTTMYGGLLRLLAVTVQPMQEVIGEVTELFVDNIDQHPYHHHVQPYQIVALGNDTDEMNGWWRVCCMPCSCKPVPECLCSSETLSVQSIFPAAGAVTALRACKAAAYACRCAALKHV